MKEYIIQYDGTSFYDQNGVLLFSYPGVDLPLYEKESLGVLELVKQGLSADDLVKLKNMGII